MVLQSQIRILDHFSIFLTIAEWRILGDLLAFLTQSLADFYEIWRNDWCWQNNELIHFGSDPADILIVIQINLEIQIQILDYLCLRFLHWQRFALSELFSCIYVNSIYMWNNFLYVHYVWQVVKVQNVLQITYAQNVMGCQLNLPLSNRKLSEK